MQTITVTNFSGPLTRTVNGDLNSGMAKFATSWGYDPFSQPGNLVWNYAPTDLPMNTPFVSILGAMVAGVKATNTYSYVVDTLSKFYFINDTQTITNIGSPNTYGVNPLYDTIQSSIASINDSFGLGGSMVFTSNRFFIGGDARVNTVILQSNGVSISGNASVFGTTSSVLTANVPHPLAEWQGYVFYGNGNNIGKIDPDLGTFGTILDGSVLNPPLPEGVTVTDIDITPEGDYMLITGSFAEPPRFGIPPNVFSSGGVINYAASSQVYYWNGSDEAVTAVRALPAFPGPSLSTFLDKQYTVNQDAFGMSLMEGNQKVLTLPSNTTPSPSAMTPNGTFLTWVCSEGVGGFNTYDPNYGTTYSSVCTSLYYFGKLDEQNPAGLWRMFRDFPGGGKVATAAPLNLMVNNFSTIANIVQGFGKHYYSTSALDTSTLANTYSRFKRFVLNPPYQRTLSQIGSPTLGVYETQTQLFSKRIAVAEVRVYCDPTVAGNGFQLDLIGSNGNPITSGTFTYTFGDIVDPQSGSTSVERINFNGTSKTQYSLGIRITNTGTTNMVIRKIEVDIEEAGK